MDTQRKNPGRRMLAVLLNWLACLLTLAGSAAVYMLAAEGIRRLLRLFGLTVGYAACLIWLLAAVVAALSLGAFAWRLRERREEGGRDGE